MTRTRTDEEAGGRRAAVLATLRAADGPMPIVDIADRLRVHPNTVRFHLDALVADGRVERAEAEQRRTGRPPQLFRAARQMDRGGPRHYLLLAEILVVGLAGDRDAATKARDAGRAWADRAVRSMPPPSTDAQPVDRLVDLLDGLGFAPQRRPADGQVRIGLRHCPFLEVATERSSVVCPVHLGLMQGALDAWDAPLTVDRLDPFVEPDLCLAHLAAKEVA
ncbi:metalloregulator ArsR/SmtB family transcription factor [Mycolicibacterium sp. F2034L]|uniref:helix-turn-helix transcriptional regulator n=1 Tax=Mycolicibacterium sp. F2034L TaxID=2926422 RepID=UPI001FF0E063|nr:helix-turn-helix domain-containing protein [Mycolicibacterium sp. F2034L]MCK0177228.1 helix-turn-helix domain-containing protein [Mycolicibacterium sp. F2034L]